MATPPIAPPQYIIDPTTLEAVQKISDEYQKQLKSSESIVSSRKKLLEQLEAEEKKAQALKEINDEIEKNLKSQNDYQAKLNQLKEQQKIIEEITDKKEQDRDKAALRAARERKEALDKEIKDIDKLIKDQQDGVKKQMELEGKLHKAREEDIKKQAEGLKMLGGLASKAGNALLEGFNFPILGVKIKGLRDIITDVIKAPAEAFKKYGFLDQYAASIDNMRQSMLDAGIGEQQMFEAFGDLNQVVADFPSYSKGLQENLVNTSAKLALAGFNSKTTATSFNNLVKVFGQTATQASATNLRLAALSKTLGDGSKTFEDFTALTPKLSGFGGKAVDVFEKTSIAAKKLGMDTKELFGIMDQYDSFENAANAAGELNVALGGQFIDSLELMQASLEGGPVDVLNLLQKSFKESGVQVESLSRAQLKYFASAAKIPEDQFKKIFAAGGQGVEGYIKQQERAAKEQENLNKIAKNTQDVFQQIQNAFAAAFADPKTIKSLVTVVVKIKDMALYFADALKTLKNLAPIMAGLFAAGSVLSFVAAVRTANIAMASLRATTLGAAIAQAFATGLTGVGLGVVAAAATAAIGTGYVVSNMIGDDSGEVKSVGSQLTSSKAVSAAEPTMPVYQDAFAPGGSIITTPQGGNFKTSAEDSVIAAKDGGVLAEKLNILIEKIDLLSERPIQMELRVDGERLNYALQKANKYNPFIAG